MTSPVVVGIPIRSFEAGKRRLAGFVGARDRRRLVRALAERALLAVGEGDATPLVVAGDRGVARWAARRGVEVVLDRGTGLDEAAGSVVLRAARTGAGWIVCHADLPLLTPEDLAPAVAAVAAGRDVIAPSKDGGTSLVGSTRVPFPFSYGEGSYVRHRGLLADPLVLTAPGLTFDVDDPDDLVAAALLPAGSWIGEILPSFAPGRAIGSAP